MSLMSSLVYWTCLMKVSIETSKIEKRTKTEKKIQNMQGLWTTTQGIHIMEIPEGDERKEQKKYLKQ